MNKIMKFDKHARIELLKLDESWHPWHYQLNHFNDEGRVSMSNFESEYEANKLFEQWREIAEGRA